MFIWIMLALALIWVGLAVWGYTSDKATKERNQRPVVDNTKEKAKLEQVRKETNDYLRTQGYSPKINVTKIEVNKTVPSKKKNYSSSSVAARTQTSKSRANNDDYNNSFLGSTAFLQTNNDSDSGRCYGGGHGGGHSGGHDTGGSDGGGSISCD